MALCHHMTQKARTMVNQQTQTTKSSLGSYKFYLIKSEAVAIPFRQKCLSEVNYLEAILKHVFFFNCMLEGYLSPTLKSIVCSALSERKKKVGKKK